MKMLLHLAEHGDGVPNALASVLILGRSALPEIDVFFLQRVERLFQQIVIQQRLGTRATEADVDRSLAEGRALKVNSTPTLFVNGRRLVGQLAWPNLRQIIDYEIDYQKTAKNAGEDCGCEVKLPSPLAN